MFVGDVRGATTGAAPSSRRATLSGTRPFSSSRTVSSKYRQVSRAVVEEELAVRAAERADRGRGRVAEPPREERAQGPEDEERRGERERGGPGRRDGDAGQDGRERARRHLEVKRARAAGHQPGGAGGSRGGGLPLEEAPARHGEAHERQDDRVEGLVRVVREEGESDDGLRERDLELLAELADEREGRLLRTRPFEDEPGDGDERESEDGAREQDPRRRGTRQDGEARDDEREQRGRQEAPPQVVEDLPLGDEREAVSLEARARRDERQEPPQDLPVPAHPAVLPARVREDVAGVVVDDLDVRDERRPRVKAFEEVVRQERVLGNTAVERRLERVDVVEALPREDSLAEQVLVRVRDRGRVRVDARVPGEHAREARGGRARRRDRDARLEDAVARDDAAGHGVEAGAVQRMLEDADERAGGVAGKPGVAVERQDVADGGQEREVADLKAEARVGRAAQEAVQLLELPALALPAHPQALGRVPAPHAVEEVEPAADRTSCSARRSRARRPRGSRRRRSALPPRRP